MRLHLAELWLQKFFVSFTLEILVCNNGLWPIMCGCGRNFVSAGSLFLVGGCWFAHSMYGRGVRMDRRCIPSWSKESLWKKHSSGTGLTRVTTAWESNSENPFSIGGSEEEVSPMWSVSLHGCWPFVSIAHHFLLVQARVLHPVSRKYNLFYNTVTR